MVPSLCASSSNALSARAPVYYSTSTFLPGLRRTTSRSPAQLRRAAHGKQFLSSRICQNTVLARQGPRKCVVANQISERLAEGKGNTRAAKQATSGTVLGAIALITGSTVGAGMLALPQATAAGGFLPSAGIMLLSWFLLTSESLLMAEVNFSIMEKHKKAGKDLDSIISLKEMAEESLGPLGGRLASGLYLFLANTLLIAYISKGGELLDLLSGHCLTSTLASVLFTLGFGGLLWKGSEKTIDFTNRAFTSVLLVLFGGLLLGGAHSANFSSLLTQQDWSEELNALPVVFLALVYHDLVPVLCKYLQWDKTKIRWSLICGSFVPLTLFIAWDAVALALVPGTTNVIEAGGALDPVRVLIETQGELGGTAIGIFSLLAIITSFIGTTLSYSESLKTEINKWMKQPKEEGKGVEVDEKLLAMCLALGPASFAAFSSPGMFFTASRIAGGYGMTLLYGVLPPMMAWSMREPKKQQSFVPGGRPVLASLTSFAASIEIGKLLSDLKGILGPIFAGPAPLTMAMNVVVSELSSLESTLGITQNLNM